MYYYIILYVCSYRSSNVEYIGKQLTVAGVLVKSRNLVVNTKFRLSNKNRE
jgi:hypothetical protein